MKTIGQIAAIAANSYELGSAPVTPWVSTRVLSPANQLVPLNKNDVGVISPGPAGDPADGDGMKTKRRA